MNKQEFSDKFDVLLNSYANRVGMGNQVSNADIALNEYEKSVFLTLAQEDEVISLYTGRNALGSSFEETEEFRRYLAPLVHTAVLSPIKDSRHNDIGGENSKFFTLPDGKDIMDESGNPYPEVWFITYEAINGDGEMNCEGIYSKEVVPVTQDEFHRIKKNPFRGPSERRALRLDLADGVVEIISTSTIINYTVRYITKPKPIILVNLEEDYGEGLTIEGESKPFDPVCELHEALHQRILEKAVLLAAQSRGMTNKKE